MNYVQRVVRVNQNMNVAGFTTETVSSITLSSSVEIRETMDSGDKIAMGF